jgi:hypothetical protein
MQRIESAPKDGSYVFAFFGGHIAAFVFYEDGQWLAPQRAGRHDLGCTPVTPETWLYAIPQFTSDREISF